MAIDQFAFEPENGFLDNTFYDDAPGNAREVLQRQHNQTRDFLNSLVATLNSKVKGFCGSENIGSASIEGVVGETIFDQIKDLKNQMNLAVVGEVPTESITGDKLAQGSVTQEKIAAEVISTGHFHGDAICPYAREPLFINGKSKEAYEPAATTASLSLFRQRACDTKISTVTGKTRGDFRYILHEKNIWQLHLETGAFTQYASTAYLNSNDLKFDFGEDGALYYIHYYVNSGNNYQYIDVYRYQYEAHQKIASIRLFYKASYYSPLMDVAIHNGVLYVGTNYSTQNQYYVYCYQVPINQLAETTFLTPFFSGKLSSLGSCFFIYEGDLYAGCYRLKQFNSQDFDKIEGEFVCGGENAGLMISGSTFLFLDHQTLLPTCASVGTLHQYAGKSFIHQNYLYTLINGYLFKARIF